MENVVNYILEDRLSVFKPMLTIGLEHKIELIIGLDTNQVVGGT